MKEGFWLKNEACFPPRYLTLNPCTDLGLRQYFTIILHITRGQQWMGSDGMRYGCWHGCPSRGSTQTAHINSVLIFMSACGLLNWLCSSVSQPLSPNLSSFLFTPSLWLAGRGSDKGDWGWGWRLWLQRDAKVDALLQLDSLRGWIVLIRTVNTSQRFVHQK